jgi:hypothetical protein
MNLLHPILACPVCMGDSGSDVSQATGTAIFFMVGLIGLVCSVFVYAIISFALKQRRFQKTLQQSHP